MDDSDRFVPECPQLIDDEIDGHRGEHGDGVCPVDAGTEACGVIEDVRWQGDRRGRIHQQRRDHLAHYERTDAGEQELPVATEPADGLVLECPKTVELIVPGISHEERDGNHHVVPANIERRAEKIGDNLILIQGRKPMQDPHHKEVNEGS